MDKYLIKNIQSAEITISDVSKKDFKSLMTSPQTQKYGLMLCGQAYCIKASEMLNKKMNEICLNDSYNREIISANSDIVIMNPNGEICISAMACSWYYAQYFTTMFNQMMDIETNRLNIAEIVVNFFNIKKNIEAISLNTQISDKCDFIMDKYINSSPDSKFNISSILQKGLNEFMSQLNPEELVEDLDYYESVDELFELSVGNIGSLDSIMSDFQKDIKELQALIEKSKKYK